MEKFGFFNSINNDRVYDAADFALFLSKYFTNGVFDGGLSVSKGSGMGITVNIGDANINGYRYSNDDTLNLSLNIGDAQYTRIDNVTIRLDLDNRKISTIIDEGIPSSSPVAKDPQRTAFLYDLVIARITIPSGTTEITASMIEDTRFNNNLCGIVEGAVKQINTTDVFAQYEAYFNNWFADLQTQLSGDIAGNLQNEITNLRIALGLDTDTFLIGESYDVGDMVIYNHVIYECNVPHVAEEFESEKWNIVPIIKN